MGIKTLKRNGEGSMVSESGLSYWEKLKKERRRLGISQWKSVARQPLWHQNQSLHKIDSERKAQPKKKNSHQTVQTASRTSD